MLTKDMKKGYTIALVEDCADALEILTIMLSRAGYTNLIAANSAQTALHKLSTLVKPVDAIITDYYLGDGTGFDVVTALKMADKVAPFCILVTGNPNASMVTSRMFDHTFLKPVRADVLVGALDTYFTNLLRMAS